MLPLVFALTLAATDSDLPVAAPAVVEQPEPARGWSIPIGARAGVVMPGAIAPYGQLLTQTAPAPLFLVDGGLEWRWFAVQAALQVAPLSGPPTFDNQNRGSSSYTVVSLGVSPSFRWAVREWLTLRAGLTLGLNAIFGSVTFTGADICSGSPSCQVNSTGFGVNFAPNLEAAVHLTGHWWLVGQVSFFSQLIGAAALSDGRTRGYGFAPFVFFSMGPEYRL